MSSVVFDSYDVRFFVGGGERAHPLRLVFRWVINGWPLAANLIFSNTWLGPVLLSMPHDIQSGLSASCSSNTDRRSITGRLVAPIDPLPFTGDHPVWPITSNRRAARLDGWPGSFVNRWMWAAGSHTIGRGRNWVRLSGLCGATVPLFGQPDSLKPGGLQDRWMSGRLAALNLV